MANKKRGKLSAKQDEVMKLLDAGQAIPEIAALMDTTPNAIKAQITRMREKGYAISTVNGRTTEAPVIAPIKATPTTTSVEGHIDSEIERVSSRLVTVEESLTSLTGEQGELSERRERLEVARTALVGAQAPARAALSAVA